MALYLITYDLNRPGQSYQTLYDTLTKWGAKRALLSVWLLKGSYDVAAMRDTLLPHLDKNDRLFVCEFTAWASYNSAVDPNGL